MRDWTVKRASGLGFASGLLAAILWPAYSLWPALRAPYGAALAVTILCGASILWMTLSDWAVHRRRGPQIRPVRGFNIAFGLLLLLPSALGLDSIL